MAIEPILIKIAEVLAPHAIRYVGPTLLGYLGVHIAHDASEIFSGLPQWVVIITEWGGWFASVLAGLLIIRQVVLDAFDLHRF